MRKILILFIITAGLIACGEDNGNNNNDQSIGSLQSVKNKIVLTVWRIKWYK